jgi:hypothetical protein
MRRAFEAAGLEPFDRLDIMARRSEGGARGAVARAFVGAPALKWVYYLYAISMGIYGVKRGA